VILGACRASASKTQSTSRALVRQGSSSMNTPFAIRSPLAEACDHADAGRSPRQIPQADTFHQAAQSSLLGEKNRLTGVRSEAFYPPGKDAALGPSFGLRHIVSARLWPCNRRGSDL